MANLITPELVELDVNITGDKFAVIHHVAQVAANSGRAELEGLEAALVERESKFVTGIKDGIAIPHSRTSAVKEPALVILRLAQPVDFGAKDGPADIVIGICAPDEYGSAHLKLLAKLSRALLKPGFIDKIRNAPTREEVADLIGAVVEPEAAKAAPAAAAEPAAPAKVTELLAVTSCATGIAHTYMAAEALETAAKKLGVTIHVETQGSGGITPFTKEQLGNAGAVILAHDVAVTGRERFAGMPIVESDVNRPINDAEGMINEALKIAEDPSSEAVKAKRAEAVAKAAPDEHVESGEAKVSWARRVQKSLLTGVSYMIPFVAAGGLLIALGFLFGGYTIGSAAGDILTNYSIFNLPDIETVFANAGVEAHVLGNLPLFAYLGAIFSTVGGVAMGFLVAALSGYVAFGLAGRPGIAPGFVGGAVSVSIGAGFLGGLVTGILAGIIAGALSKIKAARWLQGLMPVVITPLVTTMAVGGVMYLMLGRPLAAVMEALQNGLGSMSGSSQIVLGVILGLMMCFDLGGPVNKAAYLFATAGLAQATTASWEVMAAVMISGMVPPLAMALSTTIRPSLYTAQEKENGTAAWLLGLSFISEGAIPFAAADPLRVIPSMMAGGAVAGGLSMALQVASHAPHGGVFVFFAIDNFFGLVIALIAGTIVAGLLVTALKQAAAKKEKETAAAAIAA